MNYPPYGGGYSQPGQQPPPGYPPQQFPAQQAPSPQQQAPDMGSLLGGLRQLMELMQNYQAGGPVPPAQQPPSVPGDPVSAQVDQIRQMLDLIQAQGARPAARGPAVPPALSPQLAAMMGVGAMGVPPIQPPAGTIWVPGFGFVSLEILMQVLGGGGATGSRPPFRSPFARNAASVPNGEDQQPPPPYRGGPQYGGSPAVQTVQERSAAQAFRDSIGLIRMASETVNEFQSLFPRQEAVETAPVSIEDEDSPMRVIDAGGAKLVVNKSDGSLRKWETGFANLDQIFKFVGEQVESARSRSAQHPQRQQLPPGVVEMTPGYQPPPGFVPVPLDPVSGQPQFGQAALPPPPTNLPPPLGYAPRQPRVAPPSAVRPASAPQAQAPVQDAPRRWGPPPAAPR